MHSLSPPRIRPRSWFILWCIVLALEILLLVNHAMLDSSAWLATRWFVGDGDHYTWADYSARHAADEHPAFYMRSPPPMHSRFYARTQRFWEILRDFGEPWMTAILVLALLFLYRRPIVAAGSTIIATTVAGGLSALIRVVAGRTRPTHFDAANIWELFRGFRNGVDLSFPSGHATLAFALAASLCYFLPKGRPLFVAVAAGTALSRVVMEAHFYSDVIFGAAFGFTVGWFVTGCMDRLMSKHLQAVPPGTTVDAAIEHGQTLPK